MGERYNLVQNGSWMWHWCFYLLHLSKLFCCCCVFRPSEVESVDGNVGDGFAQPSRPEEGPLQTTSISPLLPFSLSLALPLSWSLSLYLSLSLTLGQTKDHSRQLPYHHHCPFPCLLDKFDLSWVGVKVAWRTELQTLCSLPPFPSSILCRTKIWKKHTSGITFSTFIVK